MSIENGMVVGAADELQRLYDESDAAYEEARSEVLHALTANPQSSVVELELMESDAVIAALGQLLKVFASCEDTGREPFSERVNFAAKQLYVAALEHAL